MSILSRCGGVAAAVALVATFAASADAAPQKCTITGTPKNDVLRGTAHADVICGLGGDDIIAGGGGDDVIYGGPGNDRLRGDAGHDRLVGGSGSDLQLGGTGDAVDRDAADRKITSHMVLNLNMHLFKGITVGARQGSESNCTSDETYGTFKPDADDWNLQLVATVKWDGACFFEDAVNQWMLSANGKDMGQIGAIRPVGEVGHQYCEPRVWPYGRCEFIHAWQAQITAP